MEKENNDGCINFVILFIGVVILAFIWIQVTMWNPHNINISGKVFDKTLISNFSYLRYDTIFNYRVYIIDNKNNIQEIPVSREDYFKIENNDELNFECIVAGQNSAYRKNCEILNE